MGVLSGGIRFRRYEVSGEVPEGFQDVFEKAIQANAFADFTEDDEREEVLGWVPVDDWYDPNLYLDRWLVENTIHLALRVETKRIPQRYLKQQCKKLEAEWKERSGAEQLTRGERDEIEKIVTKRLLERVIPSTQGLDVCWDLDRKDVLFWSTSEKANEAFRVLFEKTFGVKLRPLFPYVLALRLLGETAEPGVAAVEPAVFAHGGR